MAIKTTINYSPNFDLKRRKKTAPNIAIINGIKKKE